MQNHHKCLECDKQFQNSSNLNRHLRKIHDYTITKPTACHVKCPTCYQDQRNLSVLIAHLKTFHDISLDEGGEHFESEDLFKEWKAKIEKLTSAAFVKVRGEKRNKTNRIGYYNCHRSGDFVSKSRGIRHMKAQGSNKINTTCPAYIKRFLYDDGSVDVKYLLTHLGHKCDTGRILCTKQKNEATEKSNEEIQIEAFSDHVEETSSNTPLQEKSSNSDSNSTWDDSTNDSNSTSSLSFEDEENNLATEGKEPLKEQRIQVRKVNVDQIVTNAVKTNIKTSLDEIQQNLKNCNNSEDCNKIFRLLLPALIQSRLLKHS